MRNIQDLEKRWLKYKIKSFIPHILLSLMAIISVALLFSIFNKQLVNKTSEVILLNDKEQKVVKTKVIEDVKVAPIKPQITIKELKKEAKKIIERADDKLILAPSLDFIKSIRTNSTKSYSSDDFQQTQKKEEIPKKKIKRKTLKHKPIVQQTQPKKILIQRQETQADINHVIKRFQKNNNPALSLFIAKKYYKLGDYKQAYNYALLTNQINNSIEQSWIIFVKSLIKLNKRDQAINILKNYIKHSQSANAKVLLDDIKSGKFQ